MGVWGKENFFQKVSFPHNIYPILNYFAASSIATATATVIPTMGLLPVSISHSNPS